MELNTSRNAETTGVIFTDASRVVVRVMRTDEDSDDRALRVPRTRTWHGQ
jgi:hypothetical protein